jgi:hypothetical protein
VFVAPRIVGDGGVPLAHLPAGGAATMAEALSLGDVEVRRLGDDVLVVGSLPGARRQ